LIRAAISVAMKEDIPMSTTKNILLAGMLGGGLGLAATALVPSKATASGCLTADLVGGGSCSACELEIDGYECNGADYGVCWTDSTDNTCTNWW
jgi:hypothetical protein